MARTKTKNQKATNLPAELERKLLAKPFAPFSIETVDGRRLRFVRKFQAAMNDRILIYFTPDELHHSVIPLASIKSIRST